MEITKLEEEARRLLQQHIKTVIPTELEAFDGQPLEPEIEHFYQQILNSVHTKEQAKRSLLLSLDAQIAMAQMYDECLEEIPIDLEPIRSSYDVWYSKWKDTYLNLMKIRAIVQAFEF